MIQQGSAYWLKNQDSQQSHFNLLELASTQRAVTNYVKILTGREIPVEFVDPRGDSMTDGESIEIASRINHKNVDEVVGLALHEASHCLLTDFKILKKLGNVILSNDSYKHLFPNNDHVFLMTNRESKLNAKVERYEKQLFSSIYANKPSVDVGNKITIEDIDELIEQLNPFNEILQASLKIVNTKFKSIYEAQNISSKILILEDERILILPDGGSALIADLSESRYSISMTKVSGLSIGKSIVISESISGHDLLEAVMKSDDANLDTFNKLERDSQEWQIILKDYLERNALSILELRNKLSSIGIDRDFATVVSWVNSPDTVAPQNRREVIPKIFHLAEEKNSDDSKKCLQAVESMYKLRAQAREKLKDILNSLEVRQNETSFDVVIENLHIKFNIYKIQSIAASEIEFKHLYKLHDLESLNLEEIYG